MIRQFAVVLLALALAACRQSGGADPGKSVGELLADGDKAVCVAPEVEDALRDLIRPKMSLFNDLELPTETKTAVIQRFTIAFKLTTLQSFDEKVQRANCNTSVTITGPTVTSDPLNLDYTISPASDRSKTPVVSAATDAPTGYLTNVILEAMQAELRKQLEAETAAREAQQRAALLAQVTPGWILGRWIDRNQESTACSTGPWFAFLTNGRFAGPQSSGRWNLDGLALTVVIDSGDDPGTEASTITAADPQSFSEQLSDGRTGSYRRCSAIEMVAPPSDETDTPI